MNTTNTETLERREHERYAIWTEAAVAGRTTSRAIDATLIDVSAGGAQLRIQNRAALAGDGDLEVWARGIAVSLPVAVAGAEESWDGTLLHCQFGAFSPEEYAGLEGLLVGLREKISAARARVAGRGDRISELRRAMAK